MKKIFLLLVLSLFLFGCLCESPVIEIMQEENEELKASLEDCKRGYLLLEKEEELLRCYKHADMLQAHDNTLYGYCLEGFENMKFWKNNVIERLVAENGVCIKEDASCLQQLAACKTVLYIGDLNDN